MKPHLKSDNADRDMQRITSEFFNRIRVQLNK